MTQQSTHDGAPGTPEQFGPSARADRIGRFISGLNALLALGAFASGVAQMINAAPDDLIVETWRAFGFIVFAGLWTIVAIWPRRTPGIWELILFHKTAMTIFALIVIGVPDAATTAAVDAAVVALTAASYVLNRGWLAWRKPSNRTGSRLARG